MNQVNFKENVKRVVTDITNLKWRRWDEIFVNMWFVRSLCGLYLSGRKRLWCDDVSARADRAPRLKNGGLNGLNECEIVYMAPTEEKVRQHDIAIPLCRQRNIWSSPDYIRYEEMAGPDSTHNLHAGQSRDYLEKVSEFARSLTSRSSNDHHTRNSGTELLRSIIGWNDHYSFVAVFLRAHAMVFNGRSVGELKILLSTLSAGDLLETYIQRVGTAFQMDGIYIATINIATILEYGELKNSTECSVYGSSYHVRWLFTQVMTNILRTRDPNVLPFLHVTFIFLRSRESAGKLPRPIEDLVPWDDVSLFMDRTVKDMGSRILPYCQGLEVLPEDSILREQTYWLLSEYRVAGGELGSHFRGVAEMMPRRVGRILWLWKTLVSMRLRSDRGCSEANIEGQDWVRLESPLLVDGYS